MGLMQQPVIDPGRLVITPHPVLLDGQRNLRCDLHSGETLQAFLSRHVPDLEQGTWEVAIGGVVVRRELWCHVRPKHGQVIEVRGALGKTVLAIIALAVLTYYTFGAGSIVGIGGAYAGVGAYIAAAAIYAGGSLLINKVLGPKPADFSAASKAQDATYNLNGTRNTFRAYEPAPLQFGKCMITPDLATDQPYTFARNSDQYFATTLNCGINVDRVDSLYNGDALLSSFEGVETYHTGFPGMTEEALPLYSNTDSVAGGSLDAPAGTYIQRTGADDTIRLEVDLEYNIFDIDSKGKPKFNTEGITAQYRAVGTTTWFSLGSTILSGNTAKIQRRTLSLGVPLGQYEVQVKRNNTAGTGSGAHCEVSWTTLRSIQKDTGNYKGLSRIGVVCKATGQLNGALDELRCVAYSGDLEYWNGTAWVTNATQISNPGAQILKYARGWYDEDDVLIAGMGLPDSMIDLEALKGFIQHCIDNSYTYDYYLKDARSHAEVLDTIALAGFGQITWAGGKLSVAWAADEQPLSGVVNMATIKRGQFQVDYTLAGAADGIEATYLDASDWTNKVIRVAAPGVTTPLNPARIALEGVTSEARAAEQARYHLGQSLYQYKSIQYGTDLEHLSYRRLSVLALQHDLTQWGYGGRVQSASIDGSGFVTLQLDEPVPSPTTGNAYIGLRIPGEDVYRVLQVDTFTGPATEITLAEAWPDGVAVPGDSSGNPAHDTIWIYDFKSDPGYRVRVVQVEPEAGLKGATVTCVPESDEFWTYVKTGTYTPPPASTLPATRPVASNLQVTEAVVVQGNTKFTELQLAFEVSGQMDYAIVYAQYTDADGDSDGVERRVADTRTNEASFRINAPGTYSIIVRPYSPDGIGGGSAAAEYDTEATGTPPTNYDTLTITETAEGMRRFSWDYDVDTIQSPDVVGVEIRYSAHDDTPVWDDMTPLGGNGFHASTFESVLPSKGDWTFALRARDSSGTLSTALLTLDQTLGNGVYDIMDERAALSVGPNIASDFTFYADTGRWINEIGTKEGITNTSTGYVHLAQTAGNNPSGNCNFYEDRRFAVDPSDVFYLRVRASASGTTHDGRFGLRWLDADGVQIGSSDFIGTWTAGASNSVKTGTLTPPSTAVWGQITAWIINGVTGDDFALREVWVEKSSLMIPGSGAQLGDARNQAMVTVGNFGSAWSGLSITWSTTTTSATLTASAATLQVGGTAIAYNSANVTVSGSAGATRTFYLYYDDPTYSGGSKTLNATTTYINSINSNGRVYVATAVVTFPSSGSGSGGYSPPPCVSVDAWVIRNGKLARAGSVQRGDVLRLQDPWGDASDGIVTYAEPKLTDMVRIVSESGRTLSCSTSAPMPVEPGGFVLAPDLAGHRTWVCGRWESVTVERMPRGWVQHITVGDRCFLAGDQSPDFAHHNIKNNVPDP